MDPKNFSHIQVGKVYSQFLYHVGTDKNEYSMISDCLILGRQDYEKFKSRDKEAVGTRQASYFSLVSRWRGQQIRNTNSIFINSAIMTECVSLIFK